MENKMIPDPESLLAKSTIFRFLEHVKNICYFSRGGIIASCCVLVQCLTFLGWTSIPNPANSR